MSIIILSKSNLKGDWIVHLQQLLFVRQRCDAEFVAWWSCCRHEVCGINTPYGLKVMFPLTISVALPLAKLNEAAVFLLVGVDGPEWSDHFPRQQVGQCIKETFLVLKGFEIGITYLLKWLAFGN